MSKIEKYSPGLYETYNASTESAFDKYTRVFVSHNGLDNETRVSIQSRHYGVVMFLSNEEALAIAQMLTDAVESRAKEEA